MSKIEYRTGYKYQLVKSYKAFVGIYADVPCGNSFIDVNHQGYITIKAGYAWDGPSGPTVDSKNFMRGSLVHDALYQLMREDHLSASQHRNTADKLLRKMCREDGMTAIRAWWVYQAVKNFGKSSATMKRETITAP